MSSGPYIIYLKRRKRQEKTDNELE